MISVRRDLAVVESVDVGGGQGPKAIMVTYSAMYVVSLYLALLPSSTGAPGVRGSPGAPNKKKILAKKRASVEARESVILLRSA